MINQQPTSKQFEATRATARSRAEREHQEAEELARVYEARSLVSLTEQDCFSWFMAEQMIDATEVAQDRGYARLYCIAYDDLPVAEILTNAVESIDLAKHHEPSRWNRRTLHKKQVTRKARLLELGHELPVGNHDILQLEREIGRVTMPELSAEHEVEALMAFMQDWQKFRDETWGSL